MNRKTFSILFFVRRTKLLKNQKAPIYMRITVDGERVEISIKRSVDLAQWNTVKGCAKTGSPYSKELNHYLEQTRHLIYQYQQDLIDRHKIITAEALKNAFLHSDEDENRTILQLYSEHNAELKLHINKGVSSCTYIKHETSRRNVERFIRDTFMKNDYSLGDMDHLFIQKYESYLRIKRGCNNNSTVKYLQNLRKIIKLALENEWIREDPMRKLKLRFEEVDKPFLNETELQAIMDKRFDIPRIAQVRDVFVFCCFTGLAFVDVKSLSAKDIEIGSNSSLWIIKQRHKSKQWAHVPILPVAKQILDKYKINVDCQRKGVLLPVLSNQKMNAYLKEIADLCGIKKNLTTHCARHTFGTCVTLANKISMESVSKMLGHSSLSMTKRYARILDSTIGQEMNQLASRLQFHLS